MNLKFTHHPTKYRPSRTRETQITIILLPKIIDLLVVILKNSIEILFFRNVIAFQKNFFQIPILTPF